MTGNSLTVNDLKNYMRQRRSTRERVSIPPFDDFIKDVSSLFALRMAAEEHWGGSPRGSVYQYAEHRHEAHGLRGALPLEWAEVKSILVPEEDCPRTSLIGFIAAHCAEDVRVIASGLRRVLSRERVGTPVGKVQQLDTYCMRWLMRQPGRSFEEKAGTRQRVMAVVRREQYDTLENRVFKDFLIRAENMADSYLEELKPDFEHHRVYETTRKFKLACQSALLLQEMDIVSSISYLPQPNYVLQQDNHYSKIWSAYCRIVRLSNLAEKLWNDKGELRRRLDALKNESIWQHEYVGRVWVHTLPWFKPLDGKAEFTELSCVNHCLAGAELLKRRQERHHVTHCEDGVGVVDIVGLHTWGDELVLGGFHDNAQPRIEDVTFPMFDDMVEACDFLKLPKDKVSHHIPIQTIFSTLNDANAQDGRTEKFTEAKQNASKYCARLLGEYRALCNDAKDVPIRKLVVLSPDDWNAVTQEVVIRSFSSMDRRHVHLLWRSVATVIGFDAVIQNVINDGELVAVIDFRNDGSVLVTGLKYLYDRESRRNIPQRSVFSLSNKRRYAFFVNLMDAKILECMPFREAKVICVSGKVPASFRAQLMRFSRSGGDVFDNRIFRRMLSMSSGDKLYLEDAGGHWGQKDGALTFSREHESRVLYFDELEPMWVVGQYNERVVRKAIVEGNDRFKGGTTAELTLDEDLLQIGAGQHAVEFLFHIGQLVDSTRLHSYRELLPDVDIRKDVRLTSTISVSPGQGIAITTVAASVLKYPLVLDYLQNMKLSQWTIQKLEEEMPRSFPPTCAIVEAYPPSDWKVYSSFWGNSSTTTLGKVREQVEDYIAGRITIASLADDAFAHAQRKNINDLEPGESRLHLLDRRNVFGNVDSNLRPFWLSEQDEETLIKKLLGALSRNRYNSQGAKCLRLLAWTYRGNHPELSRLLRQIVKEYSAKQSSKSSVDAVEVSFLSNFLAATTQRENEYDTLRTLFGRLREGFANGNDLRLFYNLMQFDAGMFVKFSFSLPFSTNVICWLLRDIQNYRENRRPANYKSCIRAFLYFLRIREKERYFLRPKDMYSQQTIIDVDTASLMASIYERAAIELNIPYDDESDDVRMLRLAAKNFLEGRGTLNDIVNVVGGE